MRSAIVIILCGCAGLAVQNPASSASDTVGFREGAEAVVAEKSVPGHRLPPPKEKSPSPAVARYLKEIRESHKEAVKSFETLLSRTEGTGAVKNRESLLRRAEEAMKAKRYADAVEIYLTLLRADPWDKEALKGYQKACRLSRRRLVMPSLRIKRVAAVQSKRTKARPSTQKAAASTLQPLYEQAEQAYKSGDFRKAELLYMQLVSEAVGSTDPKAPLYYRLAKERIKELSKKAKEKRR
ncbi:MAG: hypothetical protein DRP82_02160 [Planctomycetota bacterium]|nr:MAG: hypothetical protein DRP82_02160 [Planctomycetota bacterium]